MTDEVFEIAALGGAREDQIVVGDQLFEERVRPAGLDVEKRVEERRKVRRRLERGKLAPDAVRNCDVGSLLLDRTL